MPQSEVPPSRPDPVPSRPRVTWAAIVHYVVFAVLLAVGGLYLWLKPPMINPITDPEGVKALALVQTHRAKQAPTLLQGVTEMVRIRSQQGRKARLGEWAVDKQAEGHYVVKVLLREQGSRDWVEREYSWQVDMANSRVHALSMAAIDLMRDDDLAPVNSSMPMPVR